MANNNDFDKGFFASVPRLVRTGYHQLTATTKWIYVCLKDLCGEAGTCYRMLRTLATEIGVSTGMLSESIKALREAGLITAEKKRRPGQQTKAMWHISIVNIWKSNGEKYPTRKCSLSEQSAEDFSSAEHCEENVQQMKKNVHLMNKPPAQCSPREKECSQNETKEEELQEDYFEEISDEEERIDVTPTSPGPEHSFIPSSSNLNSQEDASNLANSQQSSQFVAHAPLQSGEPSPIATPSDKANSNEVKPPDSDAQCAGLYEDNNHGDVTQGETPPSDGNTQGDNVPPDSALVETSQQTVSTNSTELDQLRFWLKELRIHGSSDATKKAADLAEILPHVHSKEDAASLHAYAEEELFRRYGEHKKAYLGNMAACVKDWVKSRGQAEYAPSPQGMSLVERDRLEDDIWDYCPDIALNHCQDERGRWFVAVFWRDDRYFELGSIDDRPKIPVEWWSRAVQYGRELAQRQAQVGQREAVAV